MSGLELQTKLVEQGHNLAVIIMSGFGDVAMAAKAMKTGAVAFIEKPATVDAVLDCVREAIARDAQRREEEREIEEVKRRLVRLTPREHEVMELVVAGNANKQAAAKLNLREKTIEIHRTAQSCSIVPRFWVTVAT